MRKRIVLFFIVIVYAFCAFAPAAGAEVQSDKLIGLAKSIIVYEKNVNGISDTDSIFSGKILENAGYDTSDWLAIGVSRFGFDEDYGAYREAWERNITEYIPTDHDPYPIKATEYHRGILTALALGEDPTDIGGYDLVKKGVYNYNFISREGINGDIWGLIAIDSLDWKTPEGSKYDRFAMMGEISMEQQEDGGFALTASMPSDPDLTAMALQAFAPYQNHEIVSHNVERAVGFLENAYDNGECTTCETLAQMIIAYCTLGEEYTSREVYSRMVEDFLSYQREDGGFAHLKEDTRSSEMPSAQALLALAAMVRQQKGCRDLYDFQKDPASSPDDRTPEYMGINTSGKGNIFTLETMSGYTPKEGTAFAKDQKTFVLLMLLIPCGIGAAAGAIYLRKKGKTKDTEEK